jgi:Methyltransferase domain
VVKHGREPPAGGPAETGGVTVAAMRVFRTEPMLEIVGWIERTPGELRCEVLDPDRGRTRYAGELVTIDHDTYVHRPWRTWTELAERLGLRMCTPRAATAPRVELRFERLDRDARWRPPAGADATERYGAGSGFERIAKHEDPGFVIDLREAVARVGLAPGARVLELGVNTGDVLALVDTFAPGMRLAGVDHSTSALAVAHARFPAATLIEADLAHLPAELGRFDLVVSVGTLQSGALDDRDLVRRVVQDHLEPHGAVIFGWPNCRYVDGEVEYGARIKNLREPELGLVVKDVAFYRKYLQQHRRHVYVTGKHYVLVTGVSEPR